MSSSSVTPNVWPPLPLNEWKPTRDTLHMWTQMVGKLRLRLAPPVNHWWHVPLYVSPLGLTTGAMPYGAPGMPMPPGYYGAPASPVM